MLENCLDVQEPPIHHVGIGCGTFFCGVVEEVRFVTIVEAG